MATKADIIVRAIVADAKKKLDELAGSLRGVGETAKPVTREIDPLVQMMIDAGADAATAAEALKAIGLSANEIIPALQAAGYTIEDVTDKVKQQGVEFLRTPKYFMGYQGGWLNLIATLGFGVSVFKVLHQTVEKILEPLTAADQRVKDFNKDLQVFIPNVEEWAKRAHEAEVANFNWGQLIRETTLAMLGLDEVLETDQLREHELAVKAAFEALKDLSQEGLRVSEERFKTQRKAILESSGSVEEYIQRLLELRGITPGVYAEIDRLTRSTFEQGAAMEFAAAKTSRLISRFKGLMELGRDFADVSSDIGAQVRDLGDIQGQYADRVGDILFSAGQAWEAYQFRIQQAVAAFNFRIDQMGARFRRGMASRLTRANLTNEAAEARHHLNIRIITEDHYDRLADMAKKHQEEMRRMLQRAPWYLQRYIREYYRQKKALEARGDKAGLAQLKKNFIERIRTIDPIFAEELEHLEQLQQDERDVEQREFGQRIDRERARFRLSRRQRQEQAAITLADQEAAYREQLDAANFAYRQQTAAREFAEQQRKEATDRALAQANRDYRRALADRQREFETWARGALSVFSDWGRRQGLAYVQGFSGAFEFPFEVRMRHERERGHQMGLAYVPATMPVVVHTGEAILRKDQAAAWRSGEGGGGGEIIINFYGPVVMRTRQQVSDLAHDISREIGRKAHLRRV